MIYSCHLLHRARPPDTVRLELYLTIILTGHGLFPHAEATETGRDKAEHGFCNLGTRKAEFV